MLEAVRQTAVLVGQFVRDVARCWKTSLRSPRHSITVALLLAIGLAPSLAMFTVLDRALFRPVELPQLDRLVFIRGVAAPPDGDPLAWWGQARALGALAGYSSGGANFSALQELERIHASVVSASFFRVADVPPAFGRTFLDDEQAPDFEHEVVLSHAFATAHFGAARSALGQAIKLNSVGYRVIGVMPSGFGFPARTDVWVPRPPRRASAAREADSDVASFDQAFIGRLRGGATLGETRTELKLMHQRLQDTYRRSGVGFGIGPSVIPLKEALARESRTALLALSGAVLFVLLLTYSNVASLLLARAVSRQKELAIFVWLGATRGRLFRQLLAESTLLALEGGALGLLLAFLGISLFRVYAPVAFPGLGEVAIGARACGFALAVSLFTGFAAGLVPALQTFKPDIAQSLKEHGERSRGSIRLNVRRALVIAEIVLALALTSGAGLMIESLRDLVRIEPGFDPRNVVTAEVALPKARYAPSAPSKNHLASTPAPRGTVGAAAPFDPARIGAFQKGLFDSIRGFPGVTAVGATSYLPLGDTGGRYFAFDVRGTPQLDTAATFDVAGDYFRAMSIPLRAGRLFADSDGDNALRVVIVNETLARRCWPSRNPVGDSLLLEGEPAAREVVGVVGDVRAESLGEVPGPQVYLPWLQPFSPQGNGAVNLRMTLVARAASAPDALAPLIRKAVSLLDSEVPLFGVESLEHFVADSAGSLRLRAVVLSFFGIVALVLAAAGVYGLMSYSVCCRVHEIGVRISLGARRRDILVLVIREGAGLGLVGTSLGLLASLEVGRLIASLLFGVTPTDVATLAAASASLLGLVLVSSALPAFRAANVDPATSIRYE